MNFEWLFRCRVPWCGLGLSSCVSLSLWKIQTMPSRFDVIVVGVGSMGSAACYYLAKRGYRVLGLEQFGIVHERGSHFGQSRIIRKAYFEHPDYVPLLERAYANWRELELDMGDKLYHETGI